LFNNNSQQGVRGFVVSSLTKKMAVVYSNIKGDAMSWSFRIARIAGTDVKIHLTFFLLLAWIGFAYYLQGGTPAALEGILFILLLFLCVLLHEFGHALAARRYGIPTPDITLLPIGGVARLQRMPDKPSQELVVALAGPAVNVVIALILALLLGRTTGLAELAQLEDPRVSLLAKLLSVNIALVVFNLLPAFPMDGGRVLRALLALRLDYVRATQIAASIGQGFAFLLGFWGLFTNPLLIFIAFFVYLGASQEAKVVQMRELAQGLPVSAAMVRDIKTLPLEAKLNDAVDVLLSTSQHDFPLLDENSKVYGILTRDTLIKALREGTLETPARQVVQQRLTTVHVRTPLEQVFSRMQEGNVSALPVVDDNGNFLGLITLENIGEMMMVRSALREEDLTAWRQTRRSSGA
jgi:Zn-dependent protease/CBS domain-containing protein